MKAEEEDIVFVFVFVFVFSLTTSVDLTLFAPRLLVWNFEGSRTLESYMMVLLTSALPCPSRRHVCLQEPSFPLNLESLVLYRRQANPKEVRLLPPPSPRLLKPFD